jgi:hypothetical protein
MGLFDGLFNSASSTKSKKSKLDEEWEKQQELLRIRRDPDKLDKYFEDVENRRAEFMANDRKNRRSNGQTVEPSASNNILPKSPLGVSGDEVYVDENADVMGKIFGKKR